MWDRRAILGECPSQLLHSFITHQHGSGGRKASLCFPDIERDEYIRLNRSSDVLSLCLQGEVGRYVRLSQSPSDIRDA